MGQGIVDPDFQIINQGRCLRIFSKYFVAYRIWNSLFHLAPVKLTKRLCLRSSNYRSVMSKIRLLAPIERGSYQRSARIMIVLLQFRGLLSNTLIKGTTWDFWQINAS